MAVAEILIREGQWDAGWLQTNHVRPVAADGFITFLRTLLGFPFLLSLNTFIMNYKISISGLLMHTVFLWLTVLSHWLT